jgi:hypothetical protein
MKNFITSFIPPLAISQAITAQISINIDSNTMRFLVGSMTSIVTTLIYQYFKNRKK